MGVVESCTCGDDIDRLLLQYKLAASFEIFGRQTAQVGCHDEAIKHLLDSTPTICTKNAKISPSSFDGRDAYFIAFEH